MSEPVLVEPDGRIQAIALSRPKARNAVDQALAEGVRARSTNSMATTS
jgi:enoyl-CoA hydratase/carnithine racemase